MADETYSYFKLNNSTYISTNDTNSYYYYYGLYGDTKLGSNVLFVDNIFFPDGINNDYKAAIRQPDSTNESESAYDLIFDGNIKFNGAVHIPSAGETATSAAESIYTKALYLHVPTNISSIIEDECRIYFNDTNGDIHVYNPNGLTDSPILTSDNFSNYINSVDTSISFPIEINASDASTYFNIYTDDYNSSYVTISTVDGSTEGEILGQVQSDIVVADTLTASTSFNVGNLLSINETSGLQISTDTSINGELNAANGLNVTGPLTVNGVAITGSLDGGTVSIPETVQNLTVSNTLTSSSAFKANYIEANQVVVGNKDIMTLLNNVTTPSELETLEVETLTSSSFISNNIETNTLKLKSKEITSISSSITTNASSNTIPTTSAVKTYVDNAISSSGGGGTSTIDLDSSTTVSDLVITSSLSLPEYNVNGSPVIVTGVVTSGIDEEWDEGTFPNSDNTIPTTSAVYNHVKAYTESKIKDKANVNADNIIEDYADDWRNAISAASSSDLGDVSDITIPSIQTGVDENGNTTQTAFSGTSAVDAINFIAMHYTTQKFVDDLAKVDASNILSYEDAWREKLDLYTKTEIDDKLETKVNIDASNLNNITDTEKKAWRNAISAISFNDMQNYVDNTFAKKDSSNINNTESESWTSTLKTLVRAQIEALVKQMQCLVLDKETQTVKVWDPNVGAYITPNIVNLDFERDNYSEYPST